MITKLKKLALSAGLCSLLSVPVLAGESGLVVGVMGGLGMLGTNSDAYGNLGIEYDWYENEKNNSSFVYGAKLGYDFYFQKEHAMRLYVDYTSGKYGMGDFITGDVNLNTFALNAEYRFDFLPIVGLFIGPNLHFTQFQTHPKVTRDDLFGDKNKVSFGFGGGIVLTPLSFLEVEGRIRYLNLGVGEKYTGALSDPDPNITRRSYEIDDPITFTLGVNLKF
ncbi:hypothetical protein CCZ01_09485 [Helicobacter monodelphidis]|uniref:outer membrane beta-barrel protein n=1 Tax=Helicobacter sp. 15-1451 TaxID=2004995 RepID=UPI000DCC82A1|nr:outer membrane beta-barrel protein [Helicobacter sp. 15-1451]RAX56449.1 hypothetical protein CCZ01_09485 [Helicobacter sp. 15-1451]